MEIWWQTKKKAVRDECPFSPLLFLCSNSFLFALCCSSIRYYTKTVYGATLTVFLSALRKMLIWMKRILIWAAQDLQNVFISYSPLFIIASAAHFFPLLLRHQTNHKANKMCFIHLHLTFFPLPVPSPPRCLPLWITLLLRLVWHISVQLGMCIEKVEMARSSFAPTLIMLICFYNNKRNGSEQNTNKIILY